MDLHDELDAELQSLFQRTGRATGYWPHYFLRAVRKNGGLALAKKLLRSNAVSSGFDRLVEARRADLSVEAVATSDRYASLFSESELAEARRRLAKLPPNAWPKKRDTIFADEVEADAQFSEGAVHKVLVNQYERNETARASCLRHHGTRCVVCSLDFGERYGEVGKGFIHVHHLLPLAGSGSRHKIDPKKDLVPVCPNCHAMLHRTDPPMDPEALRQRISV